MSEHSDVFDELYELAENPEQQEYCYTQYHSAAFLDITEKLAPSGSHAVLDAGGGYGRDCIELAKDTRFTCTVVDKSEAAGLLKTRLAGDKDADVEFICADLTKDLCDKLNGRKFDVIFSYCFLHLIKEEELGAVLTRLKSLLKDAGHMVHFFLSDEDPTGWDGSPKMGQNRRVVKESNKEAHYSETTLRSACGEATLGLRDLTYVPVFEWHGGPHHHIMWRLYCTNNRRTQLT